MTREEVIEWKEKIQCFGLMDNGGCCALAHYGPKGPSPKECMACKFRKLQREVTGGRLYPLAPPVKRVKECKSYSAGKGGDIPAPDYSHCEGCAYLSGLGNYKSCIYIQETGKRRPCRKSECKAMGIFKPIEEANRERGWQRTHSKQKERLGLQRDGAGMNGGAVLLERIRDDEMMDDVLCMKDAIEALAEERSATEEVMA